MTFSLIVPVYNVEKYLAKCLDSILNQTYQDFEIIVVNDGSPDNSQAIIDEYVKNHPQKIKSFIKENGGLSDARNFGIKKATGDYLLFIDSDDYIDKSALQGIKNEIDNCNPDIIGFNLVTVNEKKQQLSLMTRPNIKGVSGAEAIIALVEHKQCFEPACGFAYNRKYWTEKGFEFFKGIYHEDFALVPLVILRAEKVCCIELNAYYYVSTDGSITRTNTKERTLRLCADLLKGYDFLVEEYFKEPSDNLLAEKMYLAYIANAVIYRLESLSGDIKSQFKKEVKKRKVIRYLVDDTFKRKLRKCFIRIKTGI